MIPMLPRERVIFSVDSVSNRKTKEVVELVADSVGMYRLGLQTIMKDGISAAEPFRKSVMLDLRLSDIKTTINHVLRDLFINIRYVTLGPFIGLDGISEAVKVVPNTTDVLIATPMVMLSNFDLKSMNVTAASLRSVTLSIVLKAVELGVAGCLCDPHEVRWLREALGDKAVIVCNTVTSLGSPSNFTDQSTPGSAILNGADYVMVGSLISEHVQPGTVAAIIVEKIKTTLETKKILHAAP